MSKQLAGQQRLIFLDVDGVLIVHGGASGYLTPDPVLVDRVRNLAERTGAKIILASLWRLSAKKRKLLEDMKLALCDCTPELAGQGRAAEIAAYVARFRGANFGVDVDFVILDDDDGAEIAGHFYPCDPFWGLTEEIVGQILRRWRA